MCACVRPTTELTDTDAAKAKPDAPAGGISALFGDISKGLGVTSGLKKVKHTQSKTHRECSRALWYKQQYESR